MTPEQRVRELNLELPAPPAPIGNFLPWRRVGQLLYLSGQGPRNPDGKVSVGRLGKDCTVERGYDDARKVGLQILGTIRHAVGSLDHVEAVIKLLGMVNATPEFQDHPKVINGCSELFGQVWGEDNGIGARSAVGMGSLPGGIAVEIEGIFEIEP